MQLTPAMKSFRTLADDPRLPEVHRQAAEALFEIEIGRAIRADARRFYAKHGRVLRAEHPLEKVLRQPADERTGKVDVQRAIDLAYKLYGDPDTPEDMRKEITALLVALGVDPDEIRDGASSLKAFRDPEGESARAMAGQRRAMGSP